MPSDEFKAENAGGTVGTTVDPGIESFSTERMGTQ